MTATAAACYDQNIVIDLEFTPAPSRRYKNGLRNEIIEIGAVKLDSFGNTLDTFCCFVAPRIAKTVARRISSLTGIRTCDVSHAKPLNQALLDLNEWIGPGNTRIVAWSSSDRHQILSECKAKEIVVPAQMHRWLDLQKVYPRLMGIDNGQDMSLRVAADWYGVALDTTSAHRALYDAQVTAELMRQLVTSEHLQQKAILGDSLAKPGEGHETTTLGDSCDALGKLLARMLA